MKRRMSVLQKPKLGGAPLVAQWVRNPSCLSEDMGSVPGLTQWAKDLALLAAAVAYVHSSSLYSIPGPGTATSHGNGQKRKINKIYKHAHS